MKTQVEFHNRNVPDPVLSQILELMRAKILQQIQQWELHSHGCDEADLEHWERKIINAQVQLNALNKVPYASIAILEFSLPNIEL